MIDFYSTLSYFILLYLNKYSYFVNRTFVQFVTMPDYVKFLTQIFGQNAGFQAKNGRFCAEIRPF